MKEGSRKTLDDETVVAGARTGMSAPVKGALWMVGALLSFSAMAVAVRELIRVLDSLEILLLRSVVSFLLVLVVLPAPGIPRAPHPHPSPARRTQPPASGRAVLVDLRDCAVAAGDRLRDRVHDAGMDRDPRGAPPGGAPDPAPYRHARPGIRGGARHSQAGDRNHSSREPGDAGRRLHLCLLAHHHQAHHAGRTRLSRYCSTCS